MVAFAGHAGHAGQCPSLSRNAESWLSGTGRDTGSTCRPCVPLSRSQGCEWFASGSLFIKQTIERLPTALILTIFE